MPHAALSSLNQLYSPPPVALWSYHIEKQQLWWNPDMYTLFALPATLPPSWEQLEKYLKPRHRGLWPRLETKLKAGTPYYQETLERLNAGPLWLECTAFGGPAGAIVGSFKDITEQEQRWQHLQEQHLYQEQLNQLAYQVDIPTETLLQHGLEILLNYYHVTAAHIVKVLGNTVEVISQLDQRQPPDPPLLRPGQRMALQNSVIEKFYRREGVFSGDELISEPALKQRLARYGFNNLLGSTFSLRNQVAGTILCFGEKDRQLTFSETQRQFLGRFSQWVGWVLERAQCFEQLEQISLKKDRLLATVAHDLREPLHIVAQSSQLLKKQAGALARRQHHIWDMLDSACRNADGLIQELLEVAELERNPLPLKLEETDVLALLQETLVGFQKRAQNQKIALTCACAETLPLLALNPPKMRRVFENLLNNALKFTPEGGSITLSLQRKTDSVCLVIADTGIGIPPESRSELFEPFSKARRKGLQGEPSTGLGMHIVQEIVHLHGGHIAFTSEVGKGTQFTLYLPLLQTP